MAIRKSKCLNIIAEEADRSVIEIMFAWITALHESVKYRIVDCLTFFIESGTKFRKF